MGIKVVILVLLALHYVNSQGDGQYVADLSGLYRADGAGLYTADIVGQYRGDNSGLYRSDGAGSYTADNSGQYRADNSGLYKSDGTGLYVADNSGQYVDIDQVLEDGIQGPADRTTLPKPVVIQKNLVLSSPPQFGISDALRFSLGGK